MIERPENEMPDEIKGDMHEKEEAQQGGGLEVFDSIPELEEPGASCRIEVTATRTEDGVELSDPRYIADAGRKSREEYRNMGPDEREKYDAQSILGKDDV